MFALPPYTMRETVKWLLCCGLLKGALSPLLMLSKAKA